MQKLVLLVLLLSLPFATLAQESPLDLSCSDTTIEDAEIGDSYTVTCPEDCSQGTIWGTDIYTDDSNICTAAAHAGVITLEDGGEFIISFVEGLDEYPSTEQNDITSSSWGSWDISFTFSASATVIEWSTRANTFEGDEDTSFTVICPEDGSRSSLWGTEIYTDDSSICTAAVHMGIITFEDGGTVMVTILDGQDDYEGTEQNDVSSSSWGSYGRSFSVAGSNSTDDMEDDSDDMEVVEIDWSTRANTFEGETGTLIRVACPEDGETSSLWGTKIYTDDSSICTAAAQMGVIDIDDGGEFTLVILDGQDAYTGMELNDIDSSNWGSYPRSFAVLD